MQLGKTLYFLASAFLVLSSTASHADRKDCGPNAIPAISFVNVTAPPQSALTIKGKLSFPVGSEAHQRCFSGKRQVPAVVILHGSSGIDSRGEFYAQALNAAGIATLEIDMWEARGVVGATNRPSLPLLTYPDAFFALGFLSAHANISPDRIGVLGFSWGGVISMAAAEQLYAGTFGDGRQFKAHVANYPVCYAYNRTFPSPKFPPTPAQAGIQFLHLTGAPILLQIGTEDDYDNGAGHCRNLADSTNPSNNNVIELAVYEGAYHAWDRLMVAVTVPDQFANEGSVFETGVVPLVEIIPDVEQAYLSRKRVVDFFRRNL